MEHFSQKDCWLAAHWRSFQASGQGTIIFILPQIF